MLNEQLCLDRLVSLEKVITSSPFMFEQSKKEVMAETFFHLKNNSNITLQEIEEKLVEFGKVVWPYRQAYNTIFSQYADKYQEKYLLGELSKNLREKCLTVKKQVGNLFSANALEIREEVRSRYFNKEEDLQFDINLSKVKDRIKKEVEELIIGKNKEEFWEVYQKYASEVLDIDQKIDLLRTLTQNKPNLTSEVLGTIKSLKLGFSQVVGETNISLALVNQKINYFKKRLSIMGR